VKTLAEVPEATRFFFEEPHADANMVALLKKQSNERAFDMLHAILGALADADWSHRDNLIAAIYGVAKRYDVKPGPAFGIVRIATTGRTAAPDQADLMLVLGQGRVDQRIRAAIDALKAAGEG
jgi:glutamyl-tRNA synthetase